jgi:alanyl-tRNA synthetase
MEVGRRAVRRVAYGSSEDATKAHRVLADHGRGMAFIATEGVAPSNEGRGYVLRRIVRRAAQHGLRIGMKPPFLPGLADVVIEQMGHAYPELVEHRDEIRRVLAAEEERFGETLERGMAIFEEAAAKGKITGDDAFDLQATYGFPIELTQELARERGLGVNDEEYTRLMEEHREISRQGGTARYEPRFTGAPRTEFVGYEQIEARTAITAYADLGDGYFQVKLAESPFYPAGGGQVADAGWIDKGDGERADLVEALRLEHDQELVFQGSGFAEGDRVRAVVPWSVRYPTMANHTATHLLHKVLQEVLGDHVRQAGSAAAGQARFSSRTRRHHAGGAHRGGAASTSAPANLPRTSDAAPRRNPGMMMPSARPATRRSTSTAGRSSSAAAPTCGQPPRSGRSHPPESSVERRPRRIEAVTAGDSRCCTSGPERPPHCAAS